jgi:hypothetical protein
MYALTLAKSSELEADSGRRSPGHRPAIFEHGLSMLIRNSSPETTRSGVPEIGYRRRFDNSGPYRCVSEGTTDSEFAPESSMETSILDKSALGVCFSIAYASISRWTYLFWKHLTHGFAETIRQCPDLNLQILFSFLNMLQNESPIFSMIIVKVFRRFRFHRNSSKHPNRMTISWTDRISKE